jgi:L-ribulose-5-phosphate 3-epimerase
MKSSTTPTHSPDRRQFLAAGAASLCAIGLSSSRAVASRLLQPLREPLFPISLAEWSLHRTLKRDGKDNLTFPKRARDLGIDAVEYVNSFFKDKARDEAYLKELKQRCDDVGVQSVLIMCDGEGALGDPDQKLRKQAVENHHKWIDAAKALGCHSIRVNAQSRGSWDEQLELAADGLAQLTEYGEANDCNVIVENHGGLSSSGKWLSSVLKKVGRDRCGALPDFGNFRVSKDEMYDRYLGTGELMPVAKGVSAKSHAFDDDGNETGTDYRRMLRIVCIEHGWRGHIGIEYEGRDLPEEGGIEATKRLLETVRGELERELEQLQKPIRDK